MNMFYHRQFNDAIVKQCKRFKGESECPYAEGSFDAQIWVAEYFVAEMSFQKVTKKKVRDFVLSYIGKWNPYELEKIATYYDSI